ncbi:hypothetical protein G6F37_005081 [Rhizopus arrhizus]|nr:hypothetical protein G6F38_006358 [Rhizopus arrhizus]KAG1159239.1 hypothetical protein G6F37_005081 [Rhizopus arrhizus]
MDKQLEHIGNKKDGGHRYLADGVIRTQTFQNAELLLLKTSNEFKNTDKTKKYFDHHKDRFRCLSMLNYIADKHKYAKLSIFLKLKVFFAHAAGDSLSIWTLKFRYNNEKDEGFFEMYREKKLKLFERYEDKEDMLPKLMKFSWALGRKPCKQKEGVWILKGGISSYERTGRSSNNQADPENT